MRRLFGSLRRTKKGQPPEDASSVSPIPLVAGYDVQLKDLGKLHRAAALGDLEKVQKLARKRDLNKLDKANRTPLHLACANGCENVVTFLVDNKCTLEIFDGHNKSPLMKAVECKQEFCASYLLQNGADPNAVDRKSNTALHFAAPKCSISVIEKLLEYGADVDALNKARETPLLLAVASGKQEMAEFLLKKGASVNSKDRSGRTPLMTAAYNGEDALIDLLIKCGANVSDEDKNGRRAADYAQTSGYSQLYKKLIGYARGKHADLGATATNKEVKTNGPSLCNDRTEDSSSNTNADSWRFRRFDDDNVVFFEAMKELEKPSAAELQPQQSAATTEHLKVVSGLQSKKAELRKDAVSPEQSSQQKGHQVADYEQELRCLLEEKRQEAEQDHARKMERMREAHEEALLIIHQQYEAKERLQRAERLAALQSEQRRLEMLHEAEVEALQTKQAERLKGLRKSYREQPSSRKMESETDQSSEESSLLLDYRVHHYISAEAAAIKNAKEFLVHQTRSMRKRQTTLRAIEEHWHHDLQRAQEVMPDPSQSQVLEGVHRNMEEEMRQLDETKPAMRRGQALQPDLQPDLQFPQRDKIQYLTESLQRITHDLNGVLGVLSTNSQQPPPRFPFSQEPTSPLPKEDIPLAAHLSPARAQSASPFVPSAGPPLTHQWACRTGCGPRLAASTSQAVDTMLAEKWHKYFPGGCPLPCRSPGSWDGKLGGMVYREQVCLFQQHHFQARETEKPNIQGMIEANKKWLERFKLHSKVPLFPSSPKSAASPTSLAGAAWLG